MDKKELHLLHLIDQSDAKLRDGVIKLKRIEEKLRKELEQDENQKGGE